MEIDREELNMEDYTFDCEDDVSSDAVSPLASLLMLKKFQEKIIQVRYETFQKDVDYSKPSIFLAGPTVRSNQPHLISWRLEAIEYFKNRGFHGNLIIPEFFDKIESHRHKYDLPLWEFESLKKCDVIMFWIPRTRELIGLTTNHELGYWMGREREKVVYGRPHDAYRCAYLDTMWAEDYKDRFGQNYGAPIHSTLEQTVQASIGKVCSSIIEKRKTNQRNS